MSALVAAASAFFLVAVILQFQISQAIQKRNASERCNASVSKRNATNASLR
jgi:hypothetical protein